MSSNTTEKEVVQLVLDHFSRELRGLRGGWFSRTFMGDTPKEGYARFFSELDVKGRASGIVRGVWRITHDQIVGLPVSFVIPAPAGVSGMYYDRGTCDFVITADLKSVVVGWQVGPRFGRGFRYEVTEGDDECIKLRLADTLWKS